MVLIGGLAVDRLTPLIAPNSDGSEYGGKRADSRQNVFVMAVLCCADGRLPVRIRNMSQSGALVEGEAIPSEGIKAQLSRANLCVNCEVVWRRENRAGLKFDSAVSVPDWLPRRGGRKDQERVDEIVYAYKAGQGSANDRPRALSILPATDMEVVEELLFARHSLSFVTDELANDPVIFNRHLTALQMIDVAAQQLEGIARRLSSKRTPDN
jgi:hypothetical protein